MIIQPDFPEHWKTRLLVEITGDESAPMAVIRLWAHCQHNRRAYFPDMTPAQLASVCRWGNRKPRCDVALVKAGFVEKLSPKGFTAHEWNEHNAQLLQKWQAGQKGGRPTIHEKPNKNDDSEKPTDNRPLTGTKPDRPDQTRPDEIDKTRPDQTDQSEQSDRTAGGGIFSIANGGGGLDGLVAGIAASKSVRVITAPQYETVYNIMKQFFKGAGEYAKSFHKTMEKQHWKDKSGNPIADWIAVAKEYASAAERNKRLN